MSFSIQTNVNSLIAQENLRVNSNFQSQTIQRLTSGYRINSSGDDAAGLAIANKFRSDTAELTQGVRNANDGVSQLQIMDGGMNNIGKMLDRLKTLATQSASDYLHRRPQRAEQGISDPGDRNRPPGAGHRPLYRRPLRQEPGCVHRRRHQRCAVRRTRCNGTVGLDLANSVVDSKALGLRTSEFKASPAAGTNLAAASNTSIANIVTANSGDSGKATFELSGAGFSASRSPSPPPPRIPRRPLADKLNAAIQAAGNAGGASANALRTANIQANAVTDSNGNQQITFTSAGSAFQATARHGDGQRDHGEFRFHLHQSGQGRIGQPVGSRRGSRRRRGRRTTST